MKSLKHLFLTIPLIATLAGCMNISGVVRDKPTGNPISSASVTINNVSATTNAMGAYNLTGPFIPSHVIFVNAPGYNIYTKSVGKEQIHDIELVPRQ
ncbi:carboxypeptidase-like regulatory domain-containing protein [Pseudomonas sp. OTU750018]|uniref:carboxypeptidase-like regulatory domain-containing protein n=1 Tax=Pseudomonas sp. OTU750018 TaxID=2709708 RepID=UPI00141E5214|nr:carboxypeptidase-like regulatory domain-containing protein [Pseudomonas sp. OTU750018]